MPEKYSAIRARVVFCSTSFTPFVWHACVNQGNVWAKSWLMDSCQIELAPTYSPARQAAETFGLVFSAIRKAVGGSTGAAPPAGGATAAAMAFWVCLGVCVCVLD